MYTLLNNKLLIICVNQVQPHVHKGATTSMLDSLYINEKQGRIQRRGHVRGVPVYTQSTQLRTLIFECPKNKNVLNREKFNKNMPHPG